MGKKKKWKVVMVVTDEWNREAGYLTPEMVVETITAALDLPPGIEVLSMGAREVCKL
jgi:hypothetical protein